jgi:hypothetical protein
MFVFIIIKPRVVNYYYDPSEPATMNYNSTPAIGHKKLSSRPATTLSSNSGYKQLLPLHHQKQEELAQGPSTVQLFPHNHVRSSLISKRIKFMKYLYLNI